jgi:hypothetical protein
MASADTAAQGGDQARVVQACQDAPPHSPRRFLGGVGFCHEPVELGAR